jgi:hypothetical protein
MGAVHDESSKIFVAAIISSTEPGLFFLLSIVSKLRSSPRVLTPRLVYPIPQSHRDLRLLANRWYRMLLPELAFRVYK